MTAARNQLHNLLQDLLMLDDDELSDDLRREEIETWDSLTMINIAVAINETFGCFMEPEDIQDIVSIGDIVTYLQKQNVEI